MKQETIDLLRNDLLNTLKSSLIAKKHIERYGHTFEIETIPVLVERNKEGKCEEITFAQNSLIFMGENGDD